MCARCGLTTGAATFEIGAGTGTATRRLRTWSHSSDRYGTGRQVSRLPRRTLSEPALRVLVEPFETAALDDGMFDLGVSATSFHWLDEDAALAKVARVLRRGGWWAAVWNVFGDDSLPDPFHDATHSLLSGPASPPAGQVGVPFALDAPARLAALEQAEAFEAIEHQTAVGRWSSTPSRLSPCTPPTPTSPLAPIAPKCWLNCNGSPSISSGRVVRNMTTVLYTARRR